MTRSLEVFNWMKARQELHDFLCHRAQEELPEVKRVNRLSTEVAAISIGILGHLHKRIIERRETIPGVRVFGQYKFQIEELKAQELINGLRYPFLPVDFLVGEEAIFQQTDNVAILAAYYGQFVALEDPKRGTSVNFSPTGDEINVLRPVPKGLEVSVMALENFWRQKTQFERALATATLIDFLDKTVSQRAEPTFTPRE